MHPEEFVVFRVKRRKEEGGEGKNRAMREDKTLTLWLWYSGPALNYRLCCWIIRIIDYPHP